MTDKPTKILIDGIDRLGKSTLIESILNDLGYHLVIHYDKPKVLLCYGNEAYDHHNEYAMMRYQEETNTQMFNLMKTDIPIIFDRTHLGEMVYAPLYRKYPGDYVYDMELDYIKAKPFTYEYDVKLILLTTSNFDMLKDDGLSFDSNKKQEEQQMFIDAFNRSQLTNKVIVDVHNGNGQFKDKFKVYEEAIMLPVKK